MPVIKQLNPINTFIFVEFDMLIDVDFGLLQFVGDKYADDRIFYTEIFENNENVIKGLLMERENYNPLTVPAKEDINITLLNSFYDEFMEKHKQEIIENYSDITSIFDWIVKLLKSGSNMMVTIICKDELEKSIIDSMMSQLNLYDYEIIISENNEVNVKNADVLVAKFSKDLFFYQNLEGKTIYLADLLCNADLDMLEQKHVKFPNIDAVLYCENNEFKFMTMYPYDDSYSINGEFDILSNDIEEDDINEEDGEKYVFEDSDEINHGDIALLESWLSPEELEEAKIKNQTNNDDEEDDEVTLEFFNPYKDNK